MLFEMTEGPPQAQRAFNALVRAVRQLQGLGVASPLALDVSQGRPLIRLAEWPSPAVRLGVTESTIEGEGSGPVAIWRNGASGFEDTGEVVTAWHFFHTPIESDRRVLIVKSLDDERWTIIAEDCGHQVL